jgi:hypothetical protein
MIRTTLLLTLPLALLACSNEPEEADDTAGADLSQSPTSNPLIERFGDTVLVVDANGVGAKGAEPFRFGSERDEVDAGLTGAYGTAPEIGENAECGAGPMQFSTYGPLQVAYQNDRFTGWLLRAGDGVTSVDGIRPGVTTLSALKGERAVREIDSTLPGEFEYTSADFGTIRGFSEGDTITALQAGLGCVYR